MDMNVAATFCLLAVGFILAGEIMRLHKEAALLRRSVAELRVALKALYEEYWLTDPSGENKKRVEDEIRMELVGRGLIPQEVIEAQAGTNEIETHPWRGGIEIPQEVLDAVEKNDPDHLRDGWITRALAEEDEGSR